MCLRCSFVQDPVVVSGKPNFQPSQSNEDLGEQYKPREILCWMKPLVRNNDENRYPPESVSEKIDVVDVFDDDLSPEVSDSLQPNCVWQCGCF